MGVRMVTGPMTSLELTLKGQTRDPQ